MPEVLGRPTAVHAGFNYTLLLRHWWLDTSGFSGAWRVSSLLSHSVFFYGGTHQCVVESWEDGWRSLTRLSLHLPWQSMSQRCGHNAAATVGIADPSHCEMMTANLYWYECCRRGEVAALLHSRMEKRVIKSWRLRVWLTVSMIGQARFHILREIGCSYSLLLLQFPKWIVKRHSSLPFFCLPKRAAKEHARSLERSYPQHMRKFSDPCVWIHETKMLLDNICALGCQGIWFLKAWLVL